MKKTLHKRIIATAAFTLMTVLVVTGGLSLMELGFRSFVAEADRSQILDRIFFRYEPYLVSSQPVNLEFDATQTFFWNMKGQEQCDGVDRLVARFNEKGFRSENFNTIEQKQPNEIRIILTGGSAAMSWAIGDACTLDRYIKSNLEPHFPGRKIRIFNLANGAWKSFQELIAVQLHGLRLEPDLIIAMDGFNDIQHGFDMIPNKAYLGDAVRIAYDRFHKSALKTPADLLEQLTVVNWVADLLRSDSEGVSAPQQTPENMPAIAEKPQPGYMSTRLTGLPVDLNKVAERTDFDPHNRSVVDTYVRNLKMMADTTLGAGARMLIVLQPTLYLKTPMSPMEQEILWNNYHHTVNFVAQGYVRAGSLLENMTQSSPEIGFLNAGNAFKGHEGTMFADYVHLTPEGNRILADKIAKASLKMLR